MNSMPILVRSRRQICTGASELVGRPSLLMQPYFGKKEKVEYKLYSPLKKEIVRFDNRGGKEEVDLMKNKRTNWAGSSHGWLVLFNYGDRRATHDMCLLNPLSGRRVALPPLRGEPFSGGWEERYPFKVILSHSPLEDDCRAVMILGSRDRAALCSPGRSERWSPLGQWDEPLKKKSSYHDFAYSASRKSFVSAMQVRSGSWISGSLISDDLELWDAPVKTTVRAPPYSMSSDPGDVWHTYLVSEEESGRLFMVRRYYISNKRVDYNVYSIVSDDNGRDVVQLCSSLDGLVMFIGVNHCFAVKASKYPEYVPNAIYFSGVWYHGNQYADIYNYKSKAYVQLFDLTPDQKFPYNNQLPWFTLV